MIEEGSELASCSVASITAGQEVVRYVVGMSRNSARAKRRRSYTLHLQSSATEFGTRS